MTAMAINDRLLMNMLLKVLMFLSNCDNVVCGLVAEAIFSVAVTLSIHLAPFMPSAMNSVLVNWLCPSLL